MIGRPGSGSGSGQGRAISSLRDLLARWRSRLTQRQRPGPRGERLAATHLKRQGYRLLGRNLRGQGGEIDLLALAPDQRTLVIVEVKTTVGLPASPGRPAAWPQQRVDAAKQARLIKMAVALSRQQRWSDRPMRFDVVAVHLPPADAGRRARPIIRHLPHAFEAPF